MRKKFKVTVLSDNRKLDETLESEPGLCVFLDTGEFKVLLDTGASGQFIQNAERCVFIERETHIDGDICIFPCYSNSFLRPIANGTLFKDSGNGLELDDFSHELVFCCGAEDLFVYTGFNIQL